MKKLVLFLPILLLQLITGCRGSSTKDSLQACINYVGSNYSDEQLIDSLTTPDRFDDCDHLTFSIIYNYITHCKNEDASEGIYDRIALTLIYDDTFETTFMDYCGQIDTDFKFMDKVVNAIIFHIIVSDDYYINEKKRYDYLWNKVHKLLPQNIKEFYSKHHRSKLLRELIDNTIKDDL